MEITINTNGTRVLQWRSGMKRILLCYALFIFCGVVYAAVELEEDVNQLQNWGFE